MAAFGSQLAHATPFRRAAALFEALVQNHPFVDGNKRTAVMAAGYWLECEGYQLETEDEHLVQVALDVATHAISLDALAEWLEKVSVPGLSPNE